MKSIKFIVNKEILRINKIPFILTILFVIITLIIVAILVYKELKKEGIKNDKKNK